MKQETDISVIGQQQKISKEEANLCLGVGE